MTNPVDESDEIENVESADDVVDSTDATLSSDDDIPGDDESKPVRKKILALEARHKIEDYEIEKQMREALDYLDEKKPKKFFLTERPRVAESLSHQKKQLQERQAKILRAVLDAKTSAKKTESAPPSPVAKPTPIVKLKPKAKVVPQAKTKTQPHSKVKSHQHDVKAKHKTTKTVAKVKPASKPKPPVKKNSQKHPQKKSHQKTVRRK